MTGRTTELVAGAKSRWLWVQRSRPWRTLSHFTDVGGSVLTAGMSYQAVFAVFAALWLGFGIFGIVLLGHPELFDTLINQINLFVPGLIGDPEEGALVRRESLVDAGAAFGASSLIAAVALLWVAMNWFTGTRRAIRIIFGLDVKQYRNAVLLKLRDFVLALAFALAIVLSAVLTVLSSNLTAALFDLLGWSEENWLLGTMGTITRYAALYVFDVLVLMAMHRYLAEVQVSGMRLLRGCALGAIALMGLKILGTLLLGGASSNPLFASFGVLVAVLIWFNFIFRAILLTSSWIATGQNRDLGVPEDLVARSEAPAEA